MSTDEQSRGAPKRRLHDDGAAGRDAATVTGTHVDGSLELHGRNDSVPASSSDIATEAAPAAACNTHQPPHQQQQQQQQQNKQQRKQQQRQQQQQRHDRADEEDGAGDGPSTSQPDTAMQGIAMQGDDDAPMQDLGLGSSVDPEKVERLLRKAETILAHRTDRLLLVLERPLMTDNYLGCLRTAECLGVHNVWIVVQQRGYHKTEAPAPGSKQDLKEFRKRVRLSRQSAQWLDMREFATTTECVAALQAEGWAIWVTDLSPGAVSLMDRQALAGALPPKLAIVMGREADGVTEEMRAASQRRVYLPLAGFNTSLNLQVATGMVLQQLLSLCPEARGDLSEERKAAVRQDWYAKLARNEAQKSAFLAYVDSPPAPYADMQQVV